MDILHHVNDYLEGHTTLGSTVDGNIKEDLGEIFSSHFCEIDWDKLWKQRPHLIPVLFNMMEHACVACQTSHLPGVW